MKKIYLLFMALGVAGVASSQKMVGDVENFHTNLDFERMDTLAPASFAGACTPVIYNSNNGGYVGGTNGYQDLEKGQLYAGIGGDVTEVLVTYGAKDDQGGNTNYNAKIYASGATPGALLGTSNNVNISAIDTTGGLTSFTFASAVAVSGGFYATVTCDGTDTVGIVMMQDPCPTSASWELWSDGVTWVAISDATQGWGLDSDHFIFPVVNNLSTSVNGEEAVPVNVFYANNQLNITGIVGDMAIINMELVDMNGRRIQADSQPSISGDTYVYDINNIAAGNYAVLMTTTKGYIAVKVNISK